MQDRIGELRWWTRSGVVDTIEVDDQYHGQGLGRVLTAAAEAVGRLRDWAPLRPTG
jgi:hypothetical protein